MVMIFYWNSNRSFLLKFFDKKCIFEQSWKGFYTFIIENKYFLGELYWMLLFCLNLWRMLLRP